LNTTTDQAGNLRRLIATSRQSRTFAVVSGKGGVGKSNVALNLSILLSALGHRVALVDGDLGMANLDILLDVRIRSTLAHVLAGRKSLDEILVELPSGVQLVPGASGLAKIANLNEFSRNQLVSSLTALEQDNDMILVDTAAGIGPSVLQFACAAETVLVVTTPEPTAMADAYAVIKILHQRRFEGRISLLVNRVTGRGEARDCFQRLADVARQFLSRRVYDAGYILEDAKLVEAVRKRQPVVTAWPRCSASRCLAALANRLCAGGALSTQREGFFRRVANWFA
jgi:flagellar biosynthesis protein FlhG